MNMEAAPASRLFTLRIWVVADNAGTLDWRARLQDIHSGEVIYFKDWQALNAHVERALKSPPEDQIEKREPGEIPVPPENLLSEKRS